MDAEFRKWAVAKNQQWVERAVNQPRQHHNFGGCFGIASGANRAVTGHR
ncbi:Uncharacterised protein [Vibrio cholerae]|nr:Uncharacterised protein [Vibrio cholerae]